MESRAQPHAGERRWLARSAQLDARSQVTERKQFLYTLQLTRTEMLLDGGTREERDVVDAHYQRLKRLAAEGVVLLAGRTQNADASTFGIVILEADDEAEAERLMLEDPAVVHGVMQAKLYPYRIAAAAPNLGTSSPPKNRQ